MKKLLTPITLILLAGCAVSQQAQIVGSKGDKNLWSISGITHYSGKEKPMDEALRHVADGMAVACPNGITPTKEFIAGVTPNWAGVEHLSWSGTFTCK